MNHAFVRSSVNPPEKSDSFRLVKFDYDQFIISYFRLRFDKRREQLRDIGESAPGNKEK